MSYIYQILGGLGVGLFAGLTPFLLGKRKGQQNLAIVALLVSGFCGLVLGILLALPVAIVFTVVIWKKAIAAGAGKARIAAGVPLSAPDGNRVCPLCGAQLESTAISCGICGYKFSSYGDLRGS
jgi:hypothetical protein